MLDGSEPHKKPEVMDSWYMYHPLLNLSRMAIKGDDAAKELFLNSLEYSIKVAHHFNYRWPVFYDINTLEVIKAETTPGKGGERDVAGLYAHVMLQAWEITKDDRYLKEAETAAQTLKDYGFDIMYQANDTTFAAGAMLRLYKATQNPFYMDLGYLFIANLLKNVALWQCSYGYFKNFPLFFAAFPLVDAPYVAVYEEQESFSAFHNYLELAGDTPLLRSVSLLLAEFIRYAVFRAVYYYPPMLPKEMLSEQATTGEIDPELWIPVEDICDGWEKCGVVGQEVYGGGLALGILPRHYYRVPDKGFMIYIDYPTADHHWGEQIKFKVLGDRVLTCCLRLIATDGRSLDALVVKAGEKKEILEGKMTAEGHKEFIVNGDQVIEISEDKRK
jgi:hypothetical protein